MIILRVMICYVLLTIWGCSQKMPNADSNDQEGSRTLSVLDSVRAAMNIDRCKTLSNDELNKIIKTIPTPDSVTNFEMACNNRYVIDDGDTTAPLAKRQYVILEKGKFKGWRGNPSPIKLAFMNSTPDILPQDVFLEGVMAMGAWVTVCNQNMDFSSDNPHIKIYFVPHLYGSVAAQTTTGGFFEGNGDFWATSSRIEIAERNDLMSFDWSSFNGNYLCSVLMHEIGHSLGLGHQESYGDQEPLMKAVLSRPPVFLDNDDINGIRSIYGTRYSPQYTIYAQFVNPAYPQYFGNLYPIPDWHTTHLLDRSNWQNYWRLIHF